MKRIVIAALSLAASFPALAVERTGLVNSIVAPDHRPCVFVSLIGVNPADPIVMASWPWIALRQSQNGFQEALALLMMAKASGLSVTINTSGSGVAECDGYVGLAAVYLTPQ